MTRGNQREKDRAKAQAREAAAKGGKSLTLSINYSKVRNISDSLCIMKTLSFGHPRMRFDELATPAVARVNLQACSLLTAQNVGDSFSHSKGVSGNSQDSFRATLRTGALITKFKIFFFDTFV